MSLPIVGLALMSVVGFLPTSNFHSVVIASNALKKVQNAAETEYE